jgi:hypothetical protein
MKSAATGLASFLLVALCVLPARGHASTPLADGDHRFTHRFAEHPSVASIPLLVRVAGDQVQVIVEVESDVFPRGVLDEGTLYLHSSNQWIVAGDEAQKNAEDVGGCSDGPAVIDLEKREYWTC